MLGSDHPVLESCAKYFFDQEKEGGKTIQPTMVLAMSYALKKGVNNSNGSDRVVIRNIDGRKGRCIEPAAALGGDRRNDSHSFAFSR